MQLKHHLAPGSGEREARGRDGVLKKTFQSGLHRDLDGGDHSRGLLGRGSYAFAVRRDATPRSRLEW